MSVITRQDTNGTKPLLQVGELGYDNFPAGGDEGRVWVGTGTSNIAQAKKSEVMAVDSKADTHIARDDNPHGVTKAQVGLGNANDTSDADKPISIATQDALDLKANADNAVLTGIPTAPTATVGTDTTQLATTAFVKAEVASEAYSKVELNAGQLDSRYYTQTQVDDLLDAQNEASEISYDNTVSGIVATNVQDAVDEIKGSVDILDSTVVKLTGDQTIEDVKTFMSSPIVPTPTAVNQAVNKQYVDNMVISPNGSNSYAVAMAIVFGS